VTSFLLVTENVTKSTSQGFSILGPYPQSNFLATSVCMSALSIYSTCKLDH